MRNPYNPDGSRRDYPDTMSFLRARSHLDEYGCWLWAGARRHKYGELIVQGRKVYAHRYAFIHAVRPLGDREVVCHRCDMPLCVNPAHLFVGTQGDNVRDMHMKGRARGMFVPKPPPPCGTIAAISRHWRVGEKPCRLCLDAYNAYQRTRRGCGVTPPISIAAALALCPECGLPAAVITVNGHDIWQCDNTECDNWKGDR